MAENKYLDLNGLSYYSQKIKDIYLEQEKYINNDEISKLFSNFDGNISTTDNYELVVENDEVILTNKNTLKKYTIPLEFGEEFNKLNQKIDDNVSYNRVKSLSSNTRLSNGIIFETIGAPEYIDANQITNYSQYNITSEGWYAFVRIYSKTDITVQNGFSIQGVSGYVTPSIGANYVDAAVKFDVMASSQQVRVRWDSDNEEIFIFKSTDLAVRNLDYRVTFYLYDIAQHTTWEYKLTSDTKVVAGKRYYSQNRELISAAAGEEIPENSYYEHSKVIFRDFTKNISYYCDYIDCPIEIYLPEVDDENYGAWFEIQIQLDTARSITIFPSKETKVSGNGVASPKAGINIINFQFHKPTKTWLPTVTNWQLSTK